MTWTFKIDGVRTDNILLEIFKVENYNMVGLGWVGLGELFMLLKEDFIEQFEKDYDESGREMEEVQ